jgi:DNA-binding PadR family transcriptional regulator
MKHQELLTGLIRLHILQHATEGEIYGQWIIDELGRHGYRLSPGTLYPLLHGMEERGYLKSRPERAAGRLRRVYRATPTGRAALRMATGKVRELFHEILGER